MENPLLSLLRYICCQLPLLKYNCHEIPHIQYFNFLILFYFCTGTVETNGRERICLIPWDYFQNMVAKLKNKTKKKNPTPPGPKQSLGKLTNPKIKPGDILAAYLSEETMPVWLIERLT